MFLDEKNEDNIKDYLDEKDKNLYTLIFGDEKTDPKDFPDIKNKSPEELEKMGFEIIDTVELSISKSGEINFDDENSDEKNEKIAKLMNKLGLDKKK